MVICEDDLNLIERLGVHHKLINSVDDLNIVFIWAFVVLLVSLFESYHNQVAIFELLDDLFYSFNIVYPDFLSSSVLIDIFRVSFEAHQNISVPHDLEQLYLVLNNSFLFAQIFKPEKVLLIGVVKVGLVKSSSQSYTFDLFFVESLVWQFAIVFE